MNLTTIERHIAETQRRFPEARGSFSGLLNNIAFATRLIASQVRRAGLVDVLGETGDENVQGERVMKLDRIADETLIRVVANGGYVCAMGSEERAELIELREDQPAGPYVLLFDPLDGSSNIDVNVSIGTIFSVFKRLSPHDQPVQQSDLLQPGYRQVAAGYVLYGSSTMFVYSAGMGVHGFTLDPDSGEFLLSHENIRIPQKANVYSVNEGHCSGWDERSRELVQIFREGGEGRAPMASRYVGSLVADFHRNLLKGGVFFYPGARQSDDGPYKPKLRLMYEAAPLAWIAEQAGGYASDCTGPILRREPASLHERVPLIIGSAETVRFAEKFLMSAPVPPDAD
ncbi:class 1 fructose-bisphosphatase [bacterium]|nr:MAG: class 1 fructose-bisphosphatase [bacterium]RKZ13104.1 MAG: class 1 fructose-bisphosphatase [bacterium]